MFDEDREDGFSPKKKKRPNDEVDVAPLIDCTFILLMFFMVQQALNPRGDERVPTARNGTAMDKAAATVITIKLLKGDPVPKIILGDLQGEEGSVDSIPAYVQEGLAQEKSTVIIQADREAPHGFVQEVVKAINQVEGIRVGLAVKDKKQ